MSERKPMSRTIEAGHFYLFQDEKCEPVGFLSEQKKGIQLACHLATELGLSVQFLLFIDDYHGNPHLDKEWQAEEIYHTLLNSVEVQSACQFYHDAGIQPLLLSELELTTAAAHLYNQLVHVKAVSNGKRALIKSFGGALLLTKENQPSCSLIDAALYLKKIGFSRQDNTTTILPRRYKTQQDQVKNILEAIGVILPPITVIYHDDEGRIFETDDWSIRNAV